MIRFKNIPELFLTAAAHWSNNVAFRHITGGYVTEYKYASLSHLSYRYAQWLWANGVRPHHRIALWTNSTPESILACLSALRLGAIVCPIDQLTDYTLANKALEQINPQLIFVGGSQEVVADRTYPLRRLASLKQILKANDLPCLPQLRSFGPDEIAFVISRPTQSPNNIVFTHKEIIECALAFSKGIELRPDDRLLCSHHVFPSVQFILGAAPCFYRGSTLIVGAPTNQHYPQELLEIERISVFLGTPKEFQAIFREINKQLEAGSPTLRMVSTLLRQVVRSHHNLGPLMFHRLHEQFGGRIKQWVCTANKIDTEVGQCIESFGIPLMDKETLCKKFSKTPTLEYTLATEPPPVTGKLSSTQSTTWKEEVKTIGKTLAEVVDPEIQQSINPSGSLLFSPQATLDADLGLDSLGRIALHNLLQSNLSVSLDYRQIQDAVSVADIVAAVKYPHELASGPFFEVVNDKIVSYLHSQTWPYKFPNTHPIPSTETASIVIFRALVGIAFKFFTTLCNHIEKNGADRLTIDPPYILAATGESIAHSLAILTCFPANFLKIVHPVHHLHTHFTNFFASALATSVCNAIAFDEFSNLKESLDSCEKLLDQGAILIMYPGDINNRKNKHSNFSPWIAHLASRTGAPVIPTFIEHKQSILPPWTLLSYLENATITFGLPLYPPVNNPTVKELRFFTHRLSNALESLHPQHKASHQMA